jgi:DNA mismatch endonuclease (patch repair protein)
MSRIRGDSLGPETRLAAALKKTCMNFWRNARCLPGKPDFVVGAEKYGTSLAVFVHGCFWHCCPEHFKAPKSGRRGGAAGWRSKFAANVRRDRRVRRQLNRMCYRTMVVWEHDLKTKQAAERAAERILRRLTCSH